MKKLLILLFMILFLSFCVQAENKMIFKQNTAIDYKIPCEYNETLCSSSAECYITILNSSLSIIIDNATMTNNIAFHNITMNESNTTATGEYKAIINCNDGDNKLSGISTFYVTSSGDQDARIYVVILSILGIIALLLYIAFNVSENHYLLSLLIFFFAFSLLFLIPNTLINGEHSSLTLLFKIIAGLISVVFIYIFVYLSYYLLIEKILIKLGVIIPKIKGRNEK